MSSQELSSRTTTDRDGTTRREFLGNLAATAASTAVLGTAAHAFAADLAARSRGTKDQTRRGRLRRPRGLARRPLPEKRRL